MMKKSAGHRTLSRLASSIFLMLVVFVFKVEVKAQDPTLATIVIKDFAILNTDSLKFTMGLARNGSTWQRWANATFQFNVKGVAAENLSITTVPGSSQLSPSLYTVTPRVVQPSLLPNSAITKNRISITVKGPEKFEDAVIVSEDTNQAVIIGTFIITAKNGTQFASNTSLEYLNDVEYYQALAYKIQNDQLPFHIADNNIEINANLMKFIGTDPSVVPETRLNCKASFAEYLGNMVTKVTWKTTSEYLNAGFVVFRGKTGLGGGQVSFDSIVGTYTNRSELVGKGQSSKEQTYTFIDTVNDRGAAYCYKVVSMKDASTINVDKDGKEIACALCTYVPFAVIVAATPTENPFQTETTIKYRLDDDVILTAKVYDVSGQLVETLIDSKYTIRGEHEVKWIASQFAVQGMYNVILIAYPVNDPTIELSRAVVKLELMR